MRRLNGYLAALALTGWMGIAAAPAWATEIESATGATTDGLAAQSKAEAMPYVYTEWKHITMADGLPNDHIFALKNDGPWMWVGTEDGLARIEKKTGKIESWKEEDGLPWRVVVGLDVHPGTGELWIALFGAGLSRFSGGRFDQWTQMNSGLVNDVVYAVTVENDNIWAATTAGASRYNTLTREWTIYTEKNAPMEEIWNYGVCFDQKRKVYLGVWGSGVLEFDIETEMWQEYLDPDGEMEIELYRDDGIVHVITTGVSAVDDVLWVSTYFGMCRFDGRRWRGYYEHETGLPSDFANHVKGRTANEAWFATDKGVSTLVDFETDTWVQYDMLPESGEGRAIVQRGPAVVNEIRMERCLPHNYANCSEFDGEDVWVGTSKGLALGKGEGYYPELNAPSDREISGATVAETVGDE